MKKSTKRILCILAVIIILALLIGSYMATRKPEPAAVPVPTATNTPTEVPTLPPPETPETPTPTALVLMTATPVPTEEPAATPEPTATAVPEPTAEPTEEPVITEEPAVEPTEIPEVTSTPAPTEEPPVPTATSVPEPTGTPTPEPTATSTPTPEPTSTPVPTATSTPKPTATPTPEPTPATKEPYLKWDEKYMKKSFTDFKAGDTHIVLDGLNEKTFSFEIGNYPAYYDITEEEYYTARETDYKVGIDISISDTSIVELASEDSFKLGQDGNKYCLGKQPSFRLKPLNPGTVEITVTLYEVEYEKHEIYWKPAYISFTKEFDTFTFTVEVEEFKSNVVFEAGDFIPAENGYPVLTIERQYGDNIYGSVWTNGKEGEEYDAVAVFTGTGEMWEPKVRSQHNGALNPFASSGITSAYICEGITRTERLGLDASLTYVSFPSTLKVIGEATLSGAIKLKELVIPEGVERIESRAFSHSDSLESVQLPNTLKYIGMLAFGHSGSGSYSYSSLKELRIPASVEYIGYDFIFCRKNITIIFEAGADPELDECWIVTPDYLNITVKYE